MNRWGYQQKSSVAACEEGRIGMVLMEESVVCPKPRRLSVLNSSLNDHNRSRRLSLNYQSVMGDSRAGSELLDMILNKGDYSVERSSTQVALSPPFYCGSPPSRATNPVTQDTQFGNEKVTTTTFAAAPSLPSFSASKGSPGDGSCVRMNFGHTQAAVRIEGFDCLSRDQRNRSISAVA
ncbi:hypothetical protein K2173_028244 [Erythroxylum novogranatense]|uniref:Uncharacterized protein n=1 Tax=Erythroxylum novogranatense TaxID=1862640 RepID=A0AAV8U1A5_9ROSI|nr:hypothetical protein K2173_028244 [Erythroxylum novogranatense]